jgi:hypothetical protein
MSPPTNNLRQRRIDHRFMGKSQRTSHHGTQNVKIHNRTTQKDKPLTNNWR